jgi:hypothetical protein
VALACLFASLAQTLGEQDEAFVPKTRRLPAAFSRFPWNMLTIAVFFFSLWDFLTRTYLKIA